MQEFCHRCGEELPAGSGESPFCPHCGAPQLTLTMENQSGSEAGAAAGATSGTPPPPSPRRVEWKTAIRCAAGVAVIGALLSLGSMRVEMLSPVSFLWAMSASMITMGLYRKRLPAAWIDVRIGARIGAVVGLLLAVGLGTARAGGGLLARYVLHSTADFDAQMAEVTTQVQQMMVKMSAGPLPADVLAFVQSPEYRAGIMLAKFATVSAFLLLLSTVFGALAGLVRMRRGTVA